MRNVFLVAAIIGVAALVSGLVGYRFGCDPVLHQAARSGDSMSWLRHEFHLTDPQFAAIERLHGEFTGACDEHCRAIREARRRLEALRTERPTSLPAIEASERRVAELTRICETSLERHLEQVAALMSPEDGRCYLDTMRPLLARFNHAGAPDLIFSATANAHEH